MTRPKKGTSERFNCNVDAKLKEIASEKAKREGRTLTDLFVSFLNDYIKVATEQEQIDELKERVEQHEKRLIELEKQK